MSSWLSWGSTADEKKAKEQREKQERESRAASRQQRMTGQELENELPVLQPEEEQNLLEALPAARGLHTMAAFETADEANEATMKVPRLRTFDPEDAEGWFCQNEAIMTLAGVKAQATKWACVVASLEDKGSRLIAKKIPHNTSRRLTICRLKKVFEQALCRHGPGLVEEVPKLESGPEITTGEHIRTGIPRTKGPHRDFAGSTSR